MNKCDICSRNITSKSPALQCAKCEKIVHCTTACSGLTRKQISALRAIDNLEWVCQECLESSPRRSTFVVPGGDEEDEDTDDRKKTVEIDADKLLRNVSKEVEKALNREMKDLKQSMQFHSDKMDEVLTSMDAFRETIHDLKRKLVEVTNKNINLETRVGALEQHIRQLEQKQLCNQIDITNVPVQEKENVEEMVSTVARKLSLPTNDVLSAKRLGGKKDMPGPIRVVVKDESTQEKWLATAKETTIMTSDIFKELPKQVNSEKIRLNGALSAYTKQLLWNAKQELKDKSHKYVWCKKGMVYARKADKDKPIIIRSLEDIKNAAA